jgi:hypothetical protein
MMFSKPQAAGKLRLTHLALVLCLYLAACGDSAAAPAADAQAAAEAGESAPSLKEEGRQGHFLLTLQSDVNPLPLHNIHSWTVRVFTPDGRVVDDAQLMVYGGMPEHKHGFPSHPRVTGKLGNGVYRVEGVKFNMPGRWEMWFNVRAAGKDDKVIFSFDVP